MNENLVESSAGSSEVIEVADESDADSMTAIGGCSQPSKAAETKVSHAYLNSNHDNCSTTKEICSVDGR